MYLSTYIYLGLILKCVNYTRQSGIALLTEENKRHFFQNWLLTRGGGGGVNAPDPAIDQERDQESCDRGFW